MQAKQKPGMKTSKEITRRTQQAIETRNRIYETAFRIMEIKGFDNMTVEQISRDANVSVGAFYHHFKSKFDILDEVFRRADNYFREHVIGSIGAESTPGKITSYFRYYARFNEEQGVDHIRALYKTQNTIFLKKNRFMISGLRDIIDMGIEKGELLPGTMDSNEITDFLFTTARGLVYNWCIQNGSFSLEEKMSRYMGCLMQVFAPESKQQTGNNLHMKR